MSLKGEELGPPRLTGDWGVIGCDPWGAGTPQHRHRSQNMAVSSYHCVISTLGPELKSVDCTPRR